MTDAALPPFTVGIDMISDETALPRGAVRDAVNVEFDADGRARRRPGAALIEDGNFHSLWRGKAFAFCIRGTELCRVDSTGVTPLATIPSSAPVSYADLLDVVVASNVGWIGKVDASGSVSPLGVEDGRLGPVEAVGFGGLAAGRYGVAASFRRGDVEGGLSDIRFLDVGAGGGISVNLSQPLDPGITAIRLYRTTTDGDTLYRADDVPVGLMSYAIGGSPVGRVADNQWLRQMPPGNIVRAWRGRLLVARGRSVFISEPLRYGLYSPRHGFVQEPHPITMLAPVDGGVFVGTRAGVVFYQGARPGDWTRSVLGTAPPVPGSDVLIQTNLLSPRLQLGTTSEAALWLSPKGFVLGLPDGQLLQPQVDRIELSAQQGRTAMLGRQAVSVVQ
jgi:hypothetical protein